jgi:hypothetical protein
VQLLPEEDQEVTNQTAQEQVEQMKLFHKLMVEIINKTAQVTTKTITPVFKEGEHVWLEAKNLRLPYGTPKLLPQHYRPFLIGKTINLVMFKHRLPTHWNIHPIFHASLLTPHCSTNMYGPTAARPPPEIIDREPKYEVESILNHKGEG